MPQERTTIKSSAKDIKIEAGCQHSYLKLMKKISKQEQALFRQAMRGVKPLPPKAGGQVNLLPPSPNNQIRKSVVKTELTQNLFVDTCDYSITSEQLLRFVRPGIQHRIFKKLQQGQFPIKALLDLHGKTINAAREALSTFLHTCYSQQKRTVCIVHGKGKNSTPILKNQTNTWLQQSKYVLAFCSAQPKDGGAGAVYVLLKAIP